MTAVVFPKFSNLPPELRDKIFHCALPGLRLFTTKCHPFYRTEGHGVALGQDRYSPIPTPLLHTSKEARKAVQRRYTIENIFYYPDKWLPAYIDWEVDTISLGVMEFFRILEGIEANPTTFMYDNSSVNNWRKSTRNLVVTILAIEYAFEKNSHWIADFLKYFPRLDTLINVSNRAVSRQDTREALGEEKGPQCQVTFIGHTYVEVALDELSNENETDVVASGVV